MGADGTCGTPEPWCTARELAGLPGLPSTERNVRAMAERLRWASRPRAGRGGGSEYVITCLPPAVQNEVRRRRAIAAANSVSEAAMAGQAAGRRLSIAKVIDNKQEFRVREAGMAAAAGLRGKPEARMEARLLMLSQLDSFRSMHGLSISAAMERFVVAYAAGEIFVPDVVREEIGDSVSSISLRRWRKALRTQGAVALAGSYGHRKGSGTIDSSPEMLQLVIAMLVEHPHASARHIQRSLEARFAGKGVELPALRSIQRFLSDWKRQNAQVFCAIRNPDEWKNRHMLALGSADEGITRLNQRWEFDSTPADVMLVDGRHSIIGVIDVWSRRTLLYVAKVSSSAGVCQAIRRAILGWGVPEQAKLDNGKDYVSRRVTRAFNSLGVAVELSAPFSPWQKPHIERFFRTFSHDLVELLPGYIGHNVAQAQAIRASQSFAERLLTKNSTVDINMTATELQEFCDRWCRDLYETEPRHGLDGRRVIERIAEWRGEVRRVDSERALDVLLAEAPDGDGSRKVTKKGIRVDTHYYAAPELGALVGEAVQVLYDERDIGRIVVYHNDAFVCVAECPEILGVSRAEVAAVAKARQQEEINAKRRELKSIARKADTADIAWEILDAKARESERLAVLPAPNVVHITPAIEAARAAADALDKEPAAPRPGDELGPTTLAHVLQISEIVRQEQLTDDSAEGRFRRAMSILLQAEGERNDVDRAFLRRNIFSAEFRGRWEMFEDFGPSAFNLSDDYAALLPDGPAFDRLHRAQLEGQTHEK